VQENSIARLLKLINIPELETLVATALKNNPTVQQAYIALKSAQISIDSKQADQLPEVNAGLSTGKAELSSASTLTTQSSSLSISWELDVWQKLANRTQSAVLDEASAAEELRAAQASLSATVIKRYLKLIAAQQQYNVEVKRSELLLNNQDIIIERYRAGLTSLNDLESTRSDYASTLADLAALDEALNQDKRALAILIGENSQFTTLGLGDQLPLLLPQVITPIAQTPVDSIGNRPDIKAALLNIESADKLTRAAYKDMLPSFSISAGLSASDLLFGDPLWSLLGNLTAPLYQGGALQAAADQQALSAEYAYWSYRDTLLTAIQEIENSMGNDSSLQLQQKYQQQALDSAKTAEQNYHLRYSQGLVDILDLLNVQQTRFSAETTLIQINVNLLTNRIDLGLALGLGV
jgi:multidrug efflux system outer membrane protein